MSIDLTKHHVPKKFLDKVAYRTVKLLRIPTDLFFKVSHLCCVLYCIHQKAYLTFTRVLLLILFS